MFYENISIPILLEVGYNVFSDFNILLKSKNIFFEKKIIITTEDLYFKYSAKIDSLACNELIFIKGGCIEDVDFLKQYYSHKNELLIAFGGGSVLDVVKLYANQMGLWYITIPSTLSNDAIYSPISRLLINGKKESFGVKPPLGIIADIEVIKQSPKVLLLAGVGDLVSNLSALEDWELSYKNEKEVINKFAYSLSMLSANSILSFKKEDISSDVFIRELANGLVISGLAMVIAGSSRPASGSEHLISHSIDELYPERAYLHGIQVAWGHLLVEKRFRKKSYKRLLKFFNDIGLKEEIDEHIKFTENEINEIISKSKIIRNRYTILNEN